MQALALDAAAGWRWMAAGWRLFRSQPFSFIALLLLYGLVLLCANAIVVWIAEGLAARLAVSADALATVGGLLVATLTPALTIGFLQACRVAASGLQLHPLLLFAAFRAGRRTLGRLLVLGTIQMLALVVVLLATSGTEAFRADAPASAAEAASVGPRSDAARPPAEASAPAAAPSPEAQAAMQRAALQRIVQGLAYLPVTLAMWFAPMLVVWHDLTPGKALFFSVIAVWRNRKPFLVYGLAWLVVWLGLVMSIAVVAVLAGASGIAVFVAAPLVMLLLACMYCSVYPTYASVFVDPATPQVESMRIR